jgi:outer membrane lipoprotein-sorting protein
MAMVVLGGVGLAMAEDPPRPQSVEAAAEAEALDPVVEKAMADLERRSAEVRDLAARFEEQKYTALLKKPMISHGSLRIVGDVARWESQSPREVISLRTKDELRVYYPQQKTVEIFQLGREMPMPDVSPLPAPAELRRHFRIETRVAKDLDPACTDDTCLALRLVPREAALREHMEFVDVVVDPATGLLRRAEVRDADGDRTVLLFTDIRTNTGLDARELELQLPADTREVRPLEAKGRDTESKEGHTP